MRLAWNLVIFRAQALDKDWSKILETNRPMPPRYHGLYRAGATPTGNSTAS